MVGPATPENPEGSNKPVVIEIDFKADRANYAYMQMANHIKKRIQSGELEVNMPLPAERRLAEEYGVSLGTARRATEELRQWGMVYTLRSKGTFVGRLNEQPEPSAVQPVQDGVVSIHVAERGCHGSTVDFG